jgi:hypothetical protein
LSLKNQNDLNSVVLPTGNLAVAWRPIPLTWSFADKETVSHGPLVLREPAQSIFVGPSYLVERSPFDICPPIDIPAPKVGEPFTVTCGVTNRSDQHQHIDVSVDFDSLPSDVMVSCMGFWSFSMSPGARDLLSFTMVALRGGYLQLPKLQVFATGYHAFIFDSEKIDFKMFISP